MPDELHTVEQVGNVYLVLELPFHLSPTLCMHPGRELLRERRCLILIAFIDYALAHIHTGQRTCSSIILYRVLSLFTAGRANMIRPLTHASPEPRVDCENKRRPCYCSINLVGPTEPEWLRRDMQIPPLARLVQSHSAARRYREKGKRRDQKSRLDSKEKGSTTPKRSHPAASPLSPAVALSLRTSQKDGGKGLSPPASALLLCRLRHRRRQ